MYSISWPDIERILSSNIESRCQQGDISLRIGVRIQVLQQSCSSGQSPGSPTPPITKDHLNSIPLFNSLQSMQSYTSIVCTMSACCYFPRLEMNCENESAHQIFTTYCCDEYFLSIVRSNELNISILAYLFQSNFPKISKASFQSQLFSALFARLTVTVLIYPRPPSQFKQSQGKLPANIPFALRAFPVSTSYFDSIPGSKFSLTAVSKF